MLVLTRKLNQSVVVDFNGLAGLTPEQIRSLPPLVVTVCTVEHSASRSAAAKLGFTAPVEVRISREEIYGKEKQA